MEDVPQEPAAWWRNQRTNYVYVAMAASILCFLAYTAIYETFFGVSGRHLDGTTVITGILVGMLKHLAVWIPFILLEIYAFRLLPYLDGRFNPQGRLDIRRQILIIGCVAACLLPLLPPAVLVWIYG